MRGATTLITTFSFLAGMAKSGQTEHYSYGPNVLQSYDVYIPDGHGHHTELRAEKHWVVYVHGGYFRDLTVNSTSIQPAIEVLESRNTTNLTHTIDEIVGFASINYRLSAFPGVQDPATTPPNEIQNVSWPDHLDDVVAGLRDLNQHHPIDGRYVISGHSVGAQMAFLAALRTLNDTTIPKPAAVLGVSGIYDFPQILQTNPEYTNLTLNGIKDPALLGSASPAEYPSSLYAQLKLDAVVLAHSHDDGLVPWDQVDTMYTVIKDVAKTDAKIVTLQGAHNSIWGGGVQLAKAFSETLALLQAGCLP
ncbi:putative Alpha/beta hydrolase fold-3 domain-containing protein [Seiridium unicorne]|uniref:Alpha/beta hydrolase fold-3 domain-containing protein n=1 Tax=Seiridium unicorne TaxID=138068 RepID=A0ABR2UXA2_9PEZI